MKGMLRAAALAAAPVFLASCATVSTNLTSNAVRLVETKKGKLVELPEGLKIESVLYTRLSSTKSRPGEPFYVRTTEPVTLDGNPLIPMGTRINGTVTAIVPPKDNVLKAKIELSLSTISLGGRDYPFHTEADLDKSAMIEKDAKLGGKEAAKAGIGAAIPPLEAVFLADDAVKDLRYYESDKAVTIAKGAGVIVKINQPVFIPLR